MIDKHAALVKLQHETFLRMLLGIVLRLKTHGGCSEKFIVEVISLPKSDFCMNLSKGKGA